MADIAKLDDPIWEYVLNGKLEEYIVPVREFWNNVENVHIYNTGVYPIQKNVHVYADVPPGLMYRVTNTPVRSPIKNVQVFPFVPVSYLNITNVAGGASRMVSRVCADNRFKMYEFTIIEKHNLPSTYHQGQFVAFVPTDILEGVASLGKWVYLTMPEMIALCKGTVLPKVKEKVIKYI